MGEEVVGTDNVILQLKVILAKTSTVVDQEGVIHVLLGMGSYCFWRVVEVPL